MYLTKGSHKHNFKDFCPLRVDFTNFAVPLCIVDKLSSFSFSRYRSKACGHFFANAIVENCQVSLVDAQLQIWSINLQSPDLITTQQKTQTGCTVDFKHRYSQYVYSFSHETANHTLQTNHIWTTY